MRIIPSNGRILRIDAPEWFVLPAFRSAVEQGTSPASKARIATFHRHNAPFTESSDIFILFDAYESIESDGTIRWTVESSDLLDEPGLELMYNTIVDVTRELNLRHGILWLSNVGLAPA